VHNKYGFWGLGFDFYQGSEMPAHPPYLFLEDFVVDAGFEFALSGVCGCDAHGVLAAA